jgi:hypothetical protein
VVFAWCLYGAIMGCSHRGVLSLWARQRGVRLVSFVGCYLCQRVMSGSYLCVCMVPSWGVVIVVCCVHQFTGCRLLSGSYLCQSLSYLCQSCSSQEVTFVKELSAGFIVALCSPAVICQSLARELPLHGPCGVFVYVDRVKIRCVVKIYG